MDLNINEIETELNWLTEAADKINEAQNKLKEAVAKYKEIGEMSKRKLLDLRLKYHKRIDEANQYHLARKISEEMRRKADHALERNHRALKALSVARQNLTIIDNVVGESDQKATLASLRVEAQESLVEHQRFTAEFARLNVHAKIMLQKFKRSVDQTEEYFKIKMESANLLIQQQNLIHHHRADVTSWKEVYAQHMKRLEEMSNKAHLERACLQQQVEARLNEPAPATADEEEDSLESYSVTLSEDGDLLSLNSGSGVGNGTAGDDDRSSIHSDQGHGQGRASLPITGQGASASLDARYRYNQNRSVSAGSTPTTPRRSGRITCHDAKVEWHPLA